MNRRERVRAAIAHQETDFVPFHMDLTHQEHERFMDFVRDPGFLDRQGFHLHGGQYWGWPTERPDRPGHFQDDYGVTWNRTGADRDIGVIDRPILSEPDLSRLREPFLNEARIRTEVEHVLATAGDRFTLYGIGFSLFERAWSYCGMEDLLCYMITEPDFVEGLLDRICEYNLRIIDLVNEYPLDGFYFGDDWGQQHGQIMGPASWRRFLKPRLRRMYDRAKKNGKAIIQHSCGDVEALFPELVEIGLDVYQTFQPEIYDIEKVKHEFGRDLAFWGGISTQQLLPVATPDRVRDETRRIIGIMGRGGGYIASPTHAVPSDVPPENLLAMLDAFHDQKG